MEEAKRTILDSVAKNPVLMTEILRERDSPYAKYLANLILDSVRVSARRESQWEFKSLLEYGEEDFCRDGHFAVLSAIFPGETVRMWHQQAAKALGAEVMRSVIYEEDEGLILFSKEEGGYRPAVKGDAAYDFVCRIRDEGNIFDFSVDRAVSWAQELFVNRSNLSAYAAIWYDTSSLSDPARVDRKRIRREAVWRETLRLMDREPFSSEEVPKPSEWKRIYEDADVDSARTSSASSEVAASDKELGKRERATLLHAVGALRELALEHYGGKQEALIDEIERRFSAVAGLSKSNLERLLPKAKNSLTGTDKS